MTVAILALGLVGAAPAGDAEVPEKYISVDEVKALLDMKKRVTFVDVRTREQFDELHIRGAKNIPLRELPRRLDEVPRHDFVVLY
ncbi:MAG TPA: rhodanese-like domain-containing protein [Candidatus Limnocylindrales bacterium]|nr:rhodanese-like domain-containing protein [Candidatus Limnocylindrales bacterium]